LRGFSAAGLANSAIENSFDLFRLETVRDTAKQPPSWRGGHQLFLFDYLNGLSLQPRFEGVQTLIDRDQLNNGRPGIHQILQGGANLRECIQYLIHDAKGNSPAHDGRPKHDIGEYIVGLEIADARDIEIHEVQIEPEVVAPYCAVQLGKRWWV